MPAWKKGRKLYRELGSRVQETKGRIGKAMGIKPEPAKEPTKTSPSNQT